MVIKVPTKKIKNRNTLIKEYCKWKKILHIWACDAPFTKEKYNWELWEFLYKEIDLVCKEQLWIDLDTESINFLNSKKNYFSNSRIQYFDMNQLENLNFKPDIIVFWEVIEHLMNLEIALTNLKKIMSKNTLLIISTPNAYCFEWILWNFIWKEFFHPDHKMIFTYWLLKNLLKYNWIKEYNFYFCKIPHINNKLHVKILNFISNYFVYYLFPRFYNNLLFIWKKDNTTNIY